MINPARNDNIDKVYMSKTPSLPQIGLGSGLGSGYCSGLGSNRKEANILSSTPAGSLQGKKMLHSKSHSRDRFSMMILQDAALAQIKARIAPSLKPKNINPYSRVPLNSAFATNLRHVKNQFSSRFNVTDAETAESVEADTGGIKGIKTKSTVIILD